MTQMEAEEVIRFYESLNKIKINSYNREMLTAILSEDAERLENALANDADPNFIFDDTIPIILASKYLCGVWVYDGDKSHVEEEENLLIQILDILMKAGADLNMPFLDCGEITYPIRECIDCFSAKVVKFMVDSGMKESLFFEKVVEDLNYHFGWMNYASREYEDQPDVMRKVAANYEISKLLNSYNSEIQTVF